MMHLDREERALNLYNKWCHSKERDIHEVIDDLVYRGIVKYGFQLVRERCKIHSGMCRTEHNLLHLPHKTNH